MRSPCEAAGVPISAREAWRNALGITLLGCLILGVGNFVVLAGYLPRIMDVYPAAAWLQVAFTLSIGIILGLIVAWQRARGSSLAELGWRKPTTLPAIVVGVLLGIGWLGLSFVGIRHFLPRIDVTELTWLRLVLVPFGIVMAIGEEVMMRGFFMSQLHRARVATWIQILVSSACSALYHGLQNFTLEGILPSMFFFSALAGVFVLGRRSLTPSILAHGLINVFGEPYLLMMVMAVMAERGA
jgi:membrane protease YdiL (CAAX protease family)